MNNKKDLENLIIYYDYLNYLSEIQKNKDLKSLRCGKITHREFEQRINNYSYRLKETKNSIEEQKKLIKR